MKTIFITLSSPLVYRNLFSFPGCLFDELMRAVQARSDLRVIVLVNTKDLERYKSVMAAVPAGRVFLEGVTINYRRSFPQKLYYFFTSYLLYTKTTRILATMGMRPGEPPAGGKRWLNPVKWLLARTVGRIRFVRMKLSPFLYRLVFKDRPFRELFERYRPDIVFISSIYDRFDRRLIPEAYEMRVPTVGISAGWDHLDKYYLPFHVDRFLAASEQMKRAAVRFQRYPPERVSIVGYPQYDFLLNPAAYRSREETLAHMGFPPNAKYILYISGSAYCPDEPEVVGEIVRWIEAGEFGGDAYLVLRPYLGSRGKDKAFDVEKFERFANHPRVFFYGDKLPDYLDELTLFVNILRHANAVIAVYSTAVLEAGILGSPIMAAPFDGRETRPAFRSIRRFREFEHFQDVIRFGALTESMSFPELKADLAAYLRDRSFNKDKRDRMTRELCFKLDGKSSMRALEVLLRELDRNSHENRDHQS